VKKAEAILLPGREGVAYAGCREESPGGGRTQCFLRPVKEERVEATLPAGHINRSRRAELGKKSTNADIREERNFYWGARLRIKMKAF